MLKGISPLLSPERLNALYTKAELAAKLGIEVSLCGTKADGTPLLILTS